MPQVVMQQQSEEAECRTQPAAEAAWKGGAPSAGGFRRTAQSTGGAALQPVPQIWQVASIIGSGSDLFLSDDSPDSLQED